jgi:hypothetical protein
VKFLFNIFGWIYNPVNSCKYSFKKYHIFKSPSEIFLALPVSERFVILRNSWAIGNDSSEASYQSSNSPLITHVQTLSRIAARDSPLL